MDIAKAWEYWGQKSEYISAPKIVAFLSKRLPNLKENENVRIPSTTFCLEMTVHVISAENEERKNVRPHT